MRKFVSTLTLTWLSLALSMSLTGIAWSQQSPPADGTGEAQASAESPSTGVDRVPPQNVPDKKKGKGKGKGKQNQGPESRLLKSDRPASALVTKLPAPDDPDLMYFWGTCGASAALELDESRVLIASDDDNVLRVYETVEPDALVVRDAAGNVDASQSLLHKPRGTQNMYRFLKVKEYGQRNFSALEGVAQIGDLVFFTGSHARRESDGENRPNRRRFFAMKMVNRLGTMLLEPYGQPIMGLVHKMEADPNVKKSGLGNSIMAQYRQIAHLSPKLRGIDIQGLAAAPDGKTLWIALRNPLRASRAYIVPLLNPAEVVTGAPPVFADVFKLDLGNRGISYIEWAPELGEYLIVSGGLNESTGMLLHRWSGDPDSKPSAGQPLPVDLNVQSLIVGEGGKRALVFSDDSDVRVAVEDKSVCRSKVDDAGQCACGDVAGQGAKRFRARWISLEDEAAAAAP